MQAAIRHSICVLMLLLAACGAAAAQDLLSVSGAGTSRADGMPVPGAVVPVAGADAPACGGTAIHADVDERVEVGIRLRVDSSISSKRITGRLKDETEAIWRPYGIQLEWTDAGASEASESEASGIFLDVSVDWRFERSEQMRWPPVLGRVAVRPDASNRRPIHLSFDATRRMLALRTTALPAMAGIVRDFELARALGRVLAHEIGHVLLGAPYHDEAGLMRASLPADELAEPERTSFRLTCGSAGRLRSRLCALTGASCIALQPAP